MRLQRKHLLQPRAYVSTVDGPRLEAAKEHEGELTPEAVRSGEGRGTGWQDRVWLRCFPLEQEVWLADLIVTALRWDRLFHAQGNVLILL